jgi:ubiquinone/menaquinone biosynthesis C-methylase UbiE
MYESFADSYSEMMDEEIKLPVYKELLGRLHKNIATLPGALLDTSCGSGHMLEMYRSRYEPHRSMQGIDISPRMVEMTRKRLGNEVKLIVGDMRDLSPIESNSVAAVLNFFAIHHLDLEGIDSAMLESFRVLIPNGRFVLAAWEGAGTIDYGEESGIIANRYSMDQLTGVAEKTGFMIERASVDPVEGFDMEAIYLECLKYE